MYSCFSQLLFFLPEKTTADVIVKLEFKFELFIYPFHPLLLPHLLSILPKTNKPNSNDIQNCKIISNIINDIWVKMILNHLVRGSHSYNIHALICILHVPQ